MAEIMLTIQLLRYCQEGDRLELGTVIVRTYDQDGNLDDRGSANWLLITITMEVENQDRFIQDYLADTIPENIWSQGDTEGNEYVLLKEICDHWSNELALAQVDLFITHDKSGPNAHYQWTTEGWQDTKYWKFAKHSIFDILLNPDNLINDSVHGKY